MKDAQFRATSFRNEVLKAFSFLLALLLQISACENVLTPKELSESAVMGLDGSDLMHSSMIAQDAVLYWSSEGN